MATREQLERALINADKAGDTEAAKILAAEIQSFSQSQAKAETPKLTPVRGDEPISLKDTLTENISNKAKGFLKMGMPGMLMADMESTGKVIDRGGYKAGGMVTDALAPYVSPETAGTAGYVTNVGVQALPTLIGTGISKNTIQPLMKWGGKRFMQSALKPNSADIRSGESVKAVETLLKRWANVTPSGVAKLQNIKDDLIVNIQKTIDDLPTGTAVNKNGAASEIEKLISKLEKQASPSGDIKEVMKVWDDFMISHPNVFPVKLANEIKQGTYASLGGKNYGEIKGASIEGQKAIAKGLKKDIEKVVPIIKEKNAELGDILSAHRQASYRVPMADNRDIMGLSTLAENPLAAVGHMADRSPWVKSWLAQLLYHGANPTSTLLGAGGGAALKHYGLLGDK